MQSSWLKCSWSWRHYCLDWSARWWSESRYRRQILEYSTIDSANQAKQSQFRWQCVLISQLICRSRVWFERYLAEDIQPLFRWRCHSQALISLRELGIRGFGVMEYLRTTPKNKLWHYHTYNEVSRINIEKLRDLGLTI